MTKWRPEGWNNPFDIEGWGSYGYYNAHQLFHVAFESGASAMLETLRKNRGGEHHNAGEEGYGFSGTLVFIPDDKEN